MKNFKILFSILFFMALLALPTICNANPDPGCNPDEPCPIDNEVYILIIAAISVAAFKYYKTVQQKIAI